MVKDLHIKNDLCQLDCLDEFLEQVKLEWEIDGGVLMKVKLALEEVIVNVISYAYGGDTNRDIYLSVDKVENTLKMVITDEGMPFNPLEKNDPDIHLPLEERPIGGLGILLVKKLMTDVHYCRCEDKNILTLIKDLS